ncbi:transporter substrate-binding domain-containing protein [Wielerella bovis]|uniref:substrate-binding periplasmic protein n=1 Tax=Wielerella bovis TaxID=2917790 RepID=UPI0020190688|nr:transporter substrate-binding domain-containing protein [Wielerella bovis]ULJ62496.1 transporter substrate-binding domain-containing protein [Wielerella bovis]
MKIKHLLPMCVALALAACSDNSATQSNDTPPASAVSQQDTAAPTGEKVTSYLVGIDIGYPPLTFRDTKGQPSGFEVELLQAIADDQKFQINLIPDVRANLFPGLGEGKYQILVGSFEVNPERQAQAELSNPYAKGYRAILSKKDSTVKSAQDLRTAKGIVGVQKGTNSERKLVELGITPKTYDSLFNTFKGLVQEEITHVVGDSIPLTYYAISNKDESVTQEYELAHFDASAGESMLVYAVSKGNTELLGKVNQGLENLKKNGTYDQIYQKWFKNNDAKV